jgi:hypothetical protein
MFYLSGAINVVLFLIIRPELLLFPRPKKLDGEEIQVIQLNPTPRGTAPAIIPDRANVQHSPERTSAALGHEGSRAGATPSRVNSTARISDRDDI